MIIRSKDTERNTCQLESDLQTSLKVVGNDTVR